MLCPGGPDSVDVILDEDVTYYWKARSLDALGEYSQYSPVTAFFVNGVNSIPAILSSAITFVSAR